MTAATMSHAVTFEIAETCPGGTIDETTKSGWSGVAQALETSAPSCTLSCRACPGGLASVGTHSHSHSGIAEGDPGTNTLSGSAGFLITPSASAPISL